MAAGLFHSVIAVLFPSQNMGPVTQFIVGSFLFSVSKIFHPLFSFISSVLVRYRLHGNGVSLRGNFDHSEVISKEINTCTVEEDSERIESEPELAGTKINDVEVTDSEDDSEEKEPEFSFSFKFPTFEEFSKSSSPKCKKEIDNSDFAVSCTIHAGSSKEEDIPIMNDVQFIQAAKTSNQQAKDHSNGEEDNLLRHHELEFNCEKESMDTDCSSESITLDSYSDGFLSNGDFGEKVECWGSGGFDGELDEEDHSGIMDELLILEELVVDEGKKRVDFTSAATCHPHDAMTSDFLSEEDFDADYSNGETTEFEFEFDGKDDDDDGSKLRNGSRDDSEKLTSSELEDSTKLETLWEHQDLIEQLKMELRKVRATGLPTILEESESPKIMEDLKPWKIDEKFHREDCMDELHKFYKSYRERMRKFDIFNYQKMYAIGFLQLKDPLQSISSPKPSGPTLKSLLSQNFWPLKPKSSDSDPMIKFMQELQSDLEVVYVGQTCLSWEFLHWQYGKALDLWDSDPRGMHRYNEVAGDFQQFQVLMQRFIEEEHFQGPRVQYYIKQRCLFRNLVQVPVIKEDSLKDRRKQRKGERVEYVISSEMLVEIIEESIRIFWRFIRADKDCSSQIHRGTPTQLQNPADLELLMEVKKILHKKERKLKDIVRSGNCILRRFKKCREYDVDQVLYFFCQVDMKLVCRVLNMTRISREQLVWCHSKLSRISFENRKIQVEPSFLLFPCQ